LNFLIPAAMMALAAAAAGGATTPAPPPPTPATRPGAAVASKVDAHVGVIRFLEARTRRDPEDITALNRLAGEYLARFRRSGDDNDVALAARAAAQSLESVPGAQNSAGLAAKARAAFALHGFAVARDIGLQLVDQEPNKAYPFEILGDAELELGDYDRAAVTYEKMRVAGGESGAGGVNTLSRLARLALIRGDLEASRAKFEAATDAARAIDPPMPDVVAWCLVQSGQLRFSTGDWDGAEERYRAALAASPTDWPAIDHLAELLAARRQYDAAVALYVPLVARVPRPELMQNLGDVYAAMNRPSDAAVWRGKALEKYLAAATGGSAHYYHHLAGFYSDTQPDAAEALRWAKKDLEVRHSVYAYDGLAWALYQTGDASAAAAAAAAAGAMNKALSQGTRDAHILYHASLIYFRAGAGAKAKDCLKRAAETNPHFNEFHVHR